MQSLFHLLSRLSPLAPHQECQSDVKPFFIQIAQDGGFDPSSTHEEGWTSTKAAF